MEEEGPSTGAREESGGAAEAAAALVSTPTPPSFLPLFSDRAQERRLGANPDYEGDAGDAGATPAAAADAAPPLAAFAAPPSTLTDAETKFLGGDEAHTHLVRGLDFALLERVRREKEAGGTGRAARPRAFAAPAPRAPKASAAAPAIHPPSSSLAAAVLAHAEALGAPRAVRPPNRVATFLPKRTAYAYTLDTDPAPPTTVARAAADCPAPRATTTAGVAPAQLDRLARILAYVTGGKGGRKLKKKEREALLREVEEAGGRPALGAAPLAPLVARTAAPTAAGADGGSPPPPPSVADEEDDIFGGAGRAYEPQAPGPAAAGPAAPGPAPAPGGYFGPGPAAAGPGGDGLAAYGAGPPEAPAAAPAPSRPPRAFRPPDDDDDDAYAELYPSAMAGFGRQAGSDSEDEPEPGATADALAAKDAARKDKGAGKAAKAKAAAKAKKEAEKEAARTDTELAKIRAVLEKRPGKAADLDEAFEGDAKEGGGGARGKRRRLATG